MTHKPDAPVLERHRRMVVGGGPHAEWVDAWIETGPTLSWKSQTTEQWNRQAQTLANIERDGHAAGKAEGFAEGVEAALDAHDMSESLFEAIQHGDDKHRDWLLNKSMEWASSYIADRRALLPNPQSGPEFAAEHGFPPLAESGAARVRAVVEPPRGESECSCPHGIWNRKCTEHGEHSGPGRVIQGGRVEPSRGEACTCLTMSVQREVLTPRPDCPVHGTKGGER